MTDDHGGPERVVRRQVEAFNAHDLEGFLACYADDAVVSGVAPHSLVGKDTLRDFYSGRFSDSTLQCAVLSLHVLSDRWVVAHEMVTSASAEVEAVAVFQVVSDHIQSATIAREFSG